MYGKRFQEWCDQTTFHGWADLIKAKTICARIFWTISIGLVIALLLVNIATMFYKYAKDDKWTTSLVEESKTEVKFPDIILCNFNQINRTKAVEKWNLDDDLISYILGHYDHGLAFQFSNKEMEELRERFTRWRSERNDYTDFMDLLSDLSHSCMGTFSENVYFRSKRIQNPCQYAQPNVFIPEFGKCIYLKLPRNDIYVTHSGQSFGLSMILNIRMEDHTKRIENSYLGSGFTLYTLYENTWPTNWIALPAGFHSFVSLKRRVENITKDHSLVSINQLTKPPCAPKGTQTLKYLNIQAYSRNAFLYECQMKAAIENCNCTPLVKLDSYKPCEPEQIEDCIKGKEDLLDKEVKICSENCKETCEREMVKARTSLNRYPGHNQLLPLKEKLEKTGVNVTEDYIRFSYLAVDIFFETTTVQVLSWYEKQPLDQILSNFGGLLGIAAGISILTIVQMIAYLCVCHSNEEERQKSNRESREMAEKNSATTN